MESDPIQKDNSPRIARKTHTVKYSPIEFALLGPGGRHRVVIVKSESAGIDLLGAADVFDRVGKSDNFYLDKRFGEGRIHVVNSRKLPNTEESRTERRKSDYTFIWKGYSSKRFEQEIENELSIRSSDIFDSVRTKNRDDLELLIAPLIYMCSGEEKKRRRQKRLFWIVAVVAIVTYILLAASLAVSIFVSNLPTSAPS